MGGRIAEHVRKALILAAKTAPVLVVAIDASGWGCFHACAGHEPGPLGGFGGGGFGAGGSISRDSGPVIFAGASGAGGRDAGIDAHDASQDGG